MPAYWYRLGACLLAMLTLAAPGDRVRAQLPPPGTTIDAASSDTVAALLPPPVLAWVRSGELTLTLADGR